MMTPSLSAALVDAEVIHDREAIRAAIEGIADAVRADYDNGTPPPLYVTVMNGGMPEVRTG